MLSPSTFIFLFQPRSLTSADSFHPSGHRTLHPAPSHTRSPLFPSRFRSISFLPEASRLLLCSESLALALTVLRDLSRPCLPPRPRLPSIGPLLCPYPLSRAVFCPPLSLPRSLTLACLSSSSRLKQSPVRLCRYHRRTSLHLPPLHQRPPPTMLAPPTRSIHRHTYLTRPHAHHAPRISFFLPPPFWRSSMLRELCVPSDYCLFLLLDLCCLGLPCVGLILNEVVMLCFLSIFPLEHE